MAIRKQRGLLDHQEVHPDTIVRDVRPLGTVVADALAQREANVAALAGCGMAMFVMPGATPFFLALAWFLVRVRKRRTATEHLPFRLPATTDETDYGNPKPGGGFATGSGVFMLGAEVDGEELWLAKKDMLTHMLVLGTTGSGKTVTLTAIAFNALAMGGGFIYTDPKAAPNLWRNIHIMCRMLGRDDDLRLVNYMTGNASVRRGDPVRLTNTTNPFAYGNADSLTQILVSLIEVSSEGGNAVFGQNAQMAIDALMRALVELRDAGEIELSVETVRRYFNLAAYTDLPSNPVLSDQTRDSVEAFLMSVGWQKGKPLDKQPRSLPEQFQYARAYFGLALNSLTDTYGHIYRHPMGEVDMYDVLKNRRILVNTLPSLEKAPAELQQLGKVTLSSTRNAISAGLGTGMEGTVDQVTGSLPLASPTPFLVITDEYAAIPTPGYAEIMTQGRGLGIASVTASQDMAGIKKADEAGAGQIVANTKIKLGMKLEEPGDTWELWQKLAGEAHVVQTQGYSLGGRRDPSESQGMNVTYRDQMTASVSKMERVAIRDFQEQTEGEFHAFFNGTITRGAMFFDPLFDDPSGKLGTRFPGYDLRINRMLSIYPPDKRELDGRIGDLRELFDTMHRRAADEDYPDMDATPPADLAAVAVVFKTAPKDRGRMETAVRAFMAWSGATDEESRQAPGETADTEKQPLGGSGGGEGESVSPPSAPAAVPVTKESGGGGLAAFAPDLDVLDEDLDDEDDNEGGEDTERTPGDGTGKASPPETPSSRPERKPAAGSGGEPAEGRRAHADALAGLRDVVSWDEAELRSDISTVEGRLGADPKEAAATAEATVRHMVEALRYPRKPVPTKDGEGRAKLDAAIERLLSGVSGGGSTK